MTNDKDSCCNSSDKEQMQNKTTGNSQKPGEKNKQMKMKSEEGKRGEQNANKQQNVGSKQGGSRSH